MDAASLDPRLRDAEMHRSAMSGPARFTNPAVASSGGNSAGNSGGGGGSGSGGSAMAAIPPLTEPKSPTSSSSSQQQQQRQSQQSHRHPHHHQHGPRGSAHDRDPNPNHPGRFLPPSHTPYPPITSFSPETPASVEHKPATPVTSTSTTATATASAGAAPFIDAGRRDSQDEYAAHDHSDDFGGGSGGGGAGDPGDPGDPNDPKKPRACESCRGLKVRCTPDPLNPDGPCRRCSKAGRACVVTQPTRKRQKKTDSRVAELEKKIDALTASLQASRGGSGGGSGGGGGSGVGGASGPSGGAAAAATAAAAASSIVGPGNGPPRHSPAESTTSPRERGGPYQLASLARGWSTPSSERAVQSPMRVQASNLAMFGGGRADQQQQQNNHNSGGGGGGGGGSGSSSFSSNTNQSKQPYPPPPMVMAGQKRKLAESRDSVSSEQSREVPVATPASQNSSGHDYLDAIDKEILTMEKAAELFARYTNEMVPHLPAVVFPSGTKVAEVRKSKPVLFLAIMAVASSELPSIQRRLVKELMEIIADKVIIVGEKSMELIQALQVAVIWYFPPEHFEELKFYQLVHLAAVIAIDLGLGRKGNYRGGFRKYIHSTWRHQRIKKEPPPDPTSIESRRTWLVCYFLATNTSMALHRPNLVRWNPFMAESVEILESSTEAAPTDKYLCHLVWTHKLAEEVGIQFSLDDPTSMPNISDTRAQFALRAFERDLDRYKRALPEDMLQPSLQMSFHVMSLYMHEIATQPENQDEAKEIKTSCSSDELRDALSSDAPLTPAHFSALSSCLTAIEGIFEVFMSVDVSQIRCLPVFNFIRVAYAIVVLIKMYFAVSSPKSELGKVINKDDMKVQQHLDNLLEKFRAAAADDKSRPAAKLLIVLAMLRSWFQKQSQPGGSFAASKTGSGGGVCQALRDAAVQYERSAAERPPEGGVGGSTPTTAAAAAQQRTPSRPPQPPEYSATANTPLQLLSEIATNDSAAAAAPSAPSGGGTPGAGHGMFSWVGRQAAQPFMYDPAGAPTPATTAAASSQGMMAGAGGIDPSPSSWAGGSSSSAGTGAGPGAGAGAGPFNPGFDYSSLGDGFAQAMDFTLAGLTDGTFAPGYENPIPYVIGESPLMGNLMDGMGMMDTRWLSQF